MRRRSATRSGSAGARKKPNEPYRGQEQGVVDGAENNPPSFHLSRHYEVARYYTLDEHTAVPDVLFVATEVWEDLTPQQQGWLQEAANESAERQKELWRQAGGRTIRDKQKAGVGSSRRGGKPHPFPPSFTPL